MNLNPVNDLGYIYQPDLEPISDRLYRLRSDYSYIYEGKDGLHRIICPKNMITDLLSVPPIVWSFLPPSGPMQAGAVVHDLICKHKGKLPRFYHDRMIMDLWIQEKITYTWEEAADIFNEINKLTPASKIKRQLAYFFVRCYGLFKDW